MDTPSLTARIRIAVNEIHKAREAGDPSREWHWCELADRLLDRHIVLMRAANTFRPLSVLDPALDARLTPTTALARKGTQ